MSWVHTYAFTLATNATPGADPNRATPLNAEYQRRLAEWRALPFWKRWRTKKPEPPEGI